MGNLSFNILIVDDVDLNLEVLKCMIEENGDTSPDAERYVYNITTAHTGAEALELIKTNRPDLILLDVLLLDMNGFDLIKILKQSDDTHDIPVIFVTSLTSVEDEERGLTLGAVDYITKPFHHALLKARVNAQLRNIAQMRVIEELCLLDPLTSLPNRRNFDSYLFMAWGCAMREQTPFSLLMIDLDNFKQVNDKYGHQKGDVVLKLAARVIKSAIKRPADFIARWGGEEFAVILPNTEIQGAAEVAETIRANMYTAQITPLRGGNSPYTTVSIGITSILPDTNDLITDFLEQADRALYAAKNAGRNCVRVFEQ